MRIAQLKSMRSSVGSLKAKKPRYHLGSIRQGTSAIKKDLGISARSSYFLQKGRAGSNKQVVNKHCICVYLSSMSINRG